MSTSANTRFPRLRLALTTLAAATIFSLSVFACQPSPVDLSHGSREYVPADYEDVLERWTRRDKSFEDFDVNLSVAATYWSWDFTWAYAVKYAKLYGMNEQKGTAFRKKLLQEKQKHHEFFLSVATQEPEWNDLSDKDSIWRIVLIDDQKRQIPPLDIELVEPVTTAHRTFFPHLKLFSHGYRVRFPRTGPKDTAFVREETSHFILQIAGPEGKVRLKWRIGEK
jgi:hypothetical protein